MANGLGIGPPFGRIKLDPVVLDWQSRGGVASASTIAAIDVMFKRWRAGGYFAKVKYFNLMCGTALASCLKPQIYGAAPADMTNTSFVAGDYSEATGLTGDGTTKSLSAGASIETILGGIATGGLGVYIRTALSTAAVRMPIGSSDNTNAYRLRQDTTPNSSGTWGGNNSDALLAGSLPVGFNHIDRSGSTALNRYAFNSTTNPATWAAVATTATSKTPANNGQNLFVFAGNVNGSASSRITASLAGCWVCATMTAAELLDFAQSIQAAQTTLGRQV